MNISRPVLRAAVVLVALGVAASSAALAQRTEVKVESDVTDGGVRLVLTHSRSVVYVIQDEGDRIEIVYADPVLLVPRSRRFAGATLERYELKGGNRLVLETGSGYRTYQSFELRNPFRLVLDVQGTGDDVVGTQPPPRRDPSKTVVVLDPGHGGIEKGAEGPTGMLEKDVTLELARRLKQELERDRSINVVLTRDEDRLIGLDERTAIANHNQADLFVSIHLNGSVRANARGSETYFLSDAATDNEARTLAALENKAARVDEGTVYEDDGERNDIELVLWDLAQTRFMAQSSHLAESMQSHLHELTGARDRGVRQAPFRVLMGATMPAILVEVGFISNRDEEARFRSLGYRNQVVNAMAGAVREFLDRVRRTSRSPGSGGAAASAP